MNGEGGPRQAAHTITVDKPSVNAYDLKLGYQLGYGVGHEIGYAHGWNDLDDELQALFGLYRAATLVPRHAELQKARTFSDEPCRLRCGRCSRCVRAAAAVVNVQRYGQPDFPGVGQ